MNIKKLKAIRFVNIGEDPPRPKPNWVSRRQWKACVEYDFISAGQGLIYNQPLLNLEVDDIIAAFITGRGYVGIGIVTEEAVPIKDFYFDGIKMEQLNIDRKYIEGTLINNETVEGLPYLRNTIFCNANNSNSEYAVRINWQKTRDKKDAFWKTKFGLFANPSIQSNLKDQPITIKYLEECFDTKFI